MTDTPSSLLRSDLASDDFDALVFEALPHAVAVLDGHGRVVRTNRRWATGMVDPLIPVALGVDLVPHLSAIRGDHGAIAEHLHDGIERVLAGRSPRFELQYEVEVDGNPRWYLLAVAPLRGLGAVVTHTDTTVHHSVQDVLAEMAFHDGLTGLPNRTLIIDRLRMALLRAQRSEVFPAIMFIDLDGFKAVNDRYGHAVGDDLLVQVGHRLRSTVREGDTCGRWGGDEFVVLVDLNDPASVHGLIDRTTRAFDEPFDLAGTTVRIELSIGVVVSRLAEGVADLVRRADEAMYTAKRSGTGVSVVGLE